MYAGNCSLVWHLCIVVCRGLVSSIAVLTAPVGVSFPPLHKPWNLMFGHKVQLQFPLLLLKPPEDWPSLLATAIHLTREGWEEHPGLLPYYVLVLGWGFKLHPKLLVGVEEC